MEPATREEIEGGRSGMNCRVCKRDLPYIGASCSCVSDLYFKMHGRYPQIDWQKVLDQVRAIPIPVWVDSPMEGK